MGNELLRSFIKYLTIFTSIVSAIWGILRIAEVDLDLTLFLIGTIIWFFLFYIFFAKQSVVRPGKIGSVKKTEFLFPFFIRLSSMIIIIVLPFVFGYFSFYSSKEESLCLEKISKPKILIGNFVGVNIDQRDVFSIRLRNDLNDDIPNIPVELIQSDLLDLSVEEPKVNTEYCFSSGLILSSGLFDIENQIFECKINVFSSIGENAKEISLVDQKSIRIKEITRHEFSISEHSELLSEFVACIFKYHFSIQKESQLCMQNVANRENIDLRIKAICNFYIGNIYLSTGQAQLANNFYDLAISQINVLRNTKPKWLLGPVYHNKIIANIKEGDFLLAQNNLLSYKEYSNELSIDTLEQYLNGLVNSLSINPNREISDSKSNLSTVARKTDDGAILGLAEIALLAMSDSIFVGIKNDERILFKLLPNATFYKIASYDSLVYPYYVPLKPRRKFNSWLSDYSKEKGYILNFPLLHFYENKEGENDIKDFQSEYTLFLTNIFKNQHWANFYLKDEMDRIYHSEEEQISRWKDGFDPKLKKDTLFNLLFVNKSPKTNGIIYYSKGKIGLLSKRGYFYLDPVYDEIIEYENFYLLKRDGKWGLSTFKGGVILPNVLSFKQSVYEDEFTGSGYVDIKIQKFTRENQKGITIDSSLPISVGDFSIISLNNRNEKRDYFLVNDISLKKRFGRVFPKSRIIEAENLIIHKRLIEFPISEGGITKSSLFICSFNATFERLLDNITWIEYKENGINYHINGEYDTIRANIRY